MKATTGLNRFCLYAVLALLAPLAGAAEPVSAGVTEESLAAWLDKYKTAWETRDAELAAGLFTEDSTYQVNPFEPAHAGRDGVRKYWSEVTRDQRDIEFQYQVIGVNGNTGIAHWSAKVSVANTDTQIELDGVFVLEFNSATQCRSLREWWHLRSQSAAGTGK